MAFHPVVQLGPIRIARFAAEGDAAMIAGQGAGPQPGLLHGSGTEAGRRGSHGADDLRPDTARADLVIAFASIGRDAAREPAPEFVATALGRGRRPGAPARRALFVIDASRSWGNAPEFAPALRATLAAEAALAPLGRVAALGQSMGGYAALVAARLVPVDVVLAFSPQAGIGPGAVPGECRWAEWTARLPARLDWPRAPLPGVQDGARVGAYDRAQNEARDGAQAGAQVGPATAHREGSRCEPDWRPAMGAGPAPGGRVFLFHGAQDDLAQAAGFAPAPRTDHLIFADRGHSDLVPHLKARGALAGLLEAALAGDRRRLLRIASSAGGVRGEPRAGREGAR